MGKLFKYEWKKQMFSKIVIGCILLGLTLLFAAGAFLDKENWQGAAMGLLIVAGAFSALYVGIESLLVLNRDLRTKESHMLFMVPKSAYQILGAKILAAICQILLTMALFAGAFALCFTAYLSANNSFSQFWDAITQILREGVHIELSWEQALYVLAACFVGWISTIAAGFAAIISVRTVLVQTKFATLIAVVVFFLISWGMSRISQFINSLSTSGSTDFMYFSISLGVTAVITVLLLLASGWMAEKKLSV